MKKELSTLFRLPLTGAIRLLWLKIRGREVIVTGACNRCGKCCQGINLRCSSGWIQNEEQFAELLGRNPEYSRFSISERSNGRYLEFSCSLYDSHLGCRDYDNRLDICRNYPQASLLLHGGDLLEGCGYTIKEGVPFKRYLNAALNKKNPHE